MANDPKRRGSPESEGSELEKLDLSQVDARRRNMLGEEISIDWDSYTGKSTALGASLVSDVSVESGEGERPTRFTSHAVKGDPTDIVLVATRESDTSTITAHWSSPTQVNLHFEKLLKLRPLNTPRNYRTYVTLSRYPFADGIGIRVHFGTRRLGEIQKRTKRSAPGEETAAGEEPTAE